LSVHVAHRLCTSVYTARAQEQRFISTVPSSRLRIKRQIAGRLPGGKSGCGDKGASFLPVARNLHPPREVSQSFEKAWCLNAGDVWRVDWPVGLTCLRHPLPLPYARTRTTCFFVLFKVQGGRGAWSVRLSVSVRQDDTPHAATSLPRNSKLLVFHGMSRVMSICRRESRVNFCCIRNQLPWTPLAYLAQKDSNISVELSPHLKTLISSPPSRQHFEVPLGVLGSATVRQYTGPQNKTRATRGGPHMHLEVLVIGLTWSVLDWSIFKASMILVWKHDKHEVRGSSPCHFPCLSLPLIVLSPFLCFYRAERRKSVRLPLRFGRNHPQFSQRMGRRRPV